jgi:hypothetical protein
MTVAQFREKVSEYRDLIARCHPDYQLVGSDVRQPGDPRIFIDDGDLFAEIEDCDFVPLEMRLELAHACGLLLLAGSELDTVYHLLAPVQTP